MGLTAWPDPCVAACRRGETVRDRRRDRSGTPGSTRPSFAYRSASIRPAPTSEATIASVTSAAIKQSWRTLLPPGTLSADPLLAVLERLADCAPHELQEAGAQSS